MTKVIKAKKTKTEKPVQSKKGFSVLKKELTGARRGRILYYSQYSLSQTSSIIFISGKNILLLI